MDKQDLISACFALWQAKDEMIYLRVEGTSMSPLIRGGDIISLRLLPLNMIHLGDIVAFRQDHQVVVHRLIRKKRVNGRWQFCQKGDNLLSWTWIEEDNLLGRVESLRRQNRTITMIGRYHRIIRIIISLMEACLISVYEVVHPLFGRMFPGQLHRIWNCLTQATNRLVQGLANPGDRF